MNPPDEHHLQTLSRIAHRVMLERGFLPDFSSSVLAELNRITEPAWRPNAPLRDLRQLLWCSIDNDDSLDLDQLSVARPEAGGCIRVLVAVADVDALVSSGSAIDEHARHNTTSVYTPGEIFPMLPEKLSTDFSSLKFDEDRPSIVIDMRVGADGALLDSDVYRAFVHNYAKLAYNATAAWLEGEGDLPAAAAAVKGLPENLKLQDEAAQRLKEYRHAQGALSLETIQARPVFDGDQVSGLELEEKNRAKDMIENFMITANGVTARFLAGKNYPSIRRVVKTPRRWDRIVEIAAEHDYRLPAEPDSRALEDFLTRAKKVDPLRFPDLSLAVVKLLGAGEYTAEMPGDTPPGHFGLAVRDYAHSTAPNRRYTDLITHRLLKAALDSRPAPYGKEDLEQLAEHCTRQEDAANKVERQVGKSAAALLLQSRVGEQFDAIVTGAAAKGTWVRLLSLPVEGKLVAGFEGVDVGHRVRVQLVQVDVEQGFIDFKRVTSAR